MKPNDQLWFIQILTSLLWNHLVCIEHFGVSLPQMMILANSRFNWRMLKVKRLHWLVSLVLVVQRLLTRWSTSSDGTTIGRGTVLDVTENSLSSVDGIETLKHQSGLSGHHRALGTYIAALVWHIWGDKLLLVLPAHSRLNGLLGVRKLIHDIPSLLLKLCIHWHLELMVDCEWAQSQAVQPKRLLLLFATLLFLF